VLLCSMMALLYADQNLLAPNLTAIADEFGFSAEERDRKLGGELALGFFILGAPFALLAGYLSDLTNRKALFVAVVFLGEVPCLGTLFVTQYWELLVLRCCTGLAIGGGAPLVMSMLGDMFPSHQRMTVLGYCVCVCVCVCVLPFVLWKLNWDSSWLECC
jgi:MFS family permease